MSCPTGTKNGTAACTPRVSLLSNFGDRSPRARGWVGSGIQYQGSHATGMPKSSMDGCSTITEALSRS